MSIIQAFESAVNQSIINNPKEDGDYIGENGLLYCGKCNTPKQTKVEIPSLGIIKYPHCLCKCRAEKLDAEDEKRKLEERARRIADSRRLAFPKEEREKMQQWTFANDDMQNPRITKAMQNYVDHFPEFRKQGKGLLLYGVCGTGKTYAACEVANALIDNGYSVLVTNFARVLNTLQGSQDKQEHIDRLNGYSLLVIDDLGVERGTEYAKEQVFNIIDSRYRAGLPMIITTNLTMDDIKNPDTITDKRIYERILEKCHPIEVDGDNRRRKTIRNEYNEMQNLLGL